MKSVHTNAEGKHPTAVYDCWVRDEFTEEMIEKLFPRVWGQSVSAAGWAHTSDGSRWYMLISNGDSTTRADIVNRLKKAGVMNLKVSVWMSVAGCSTAVRIGTPRRGTKRLLKNEPRGKVIAAR